MKNEQNEEIEEILDTLQDLENEYYGYSAKFKDILRNYNREISVEYILDEMLKALEKLIIYIGSYREQTSKRERINSLIGRDKKVEVTKPTLVLLKTLEEEYSGYSAIFKYILSDDNSVINVSYIAGEMITVLKQIRTLIRKYREQIAKKEENLNNLSDKREPIDNESER